MDMSEEVKFSRGSTLPIHPHVHMRFAF